MNFGKIHNEPPAAYHSGEAVSHSRLEVFRKRPALYYKRFVAKTLAPERSEAFAFGSAAHCGILEPYAFAQRYATRPEGIDRRTKQGKADWDAFCAENDGKEVISGEDAATLREMTAAVHNHKAAATLLANGESEVTWRTKPSGSLPLPLQCRTDWFCSEGCELSEGRPYVADLKTVDSLDDAEFRNFARAFVNFGYHRQCGFYLPLLHECGVPVRDFFFIASEKREPFGVCVYKPTDDAIAKGQDETVADLVALARCYKANDWPNMPQTVQEISLPEWYA